MTLVKNAHKPVHIVTSSIKNLNPNLSHFFKFKTTRPPEYIESLVNSLDQSAGELWLCKTHQENWCMRDLKDNQG